MSKKCSEAVGLLTELQILFELIQPFLFINETVEILFNPFMPGSNKKVTHT